MSTELILVNPTEFGIEEKTANNFLKGLEVSLAERDLLDKEFEIVSKLEMNSENVIKFRELRIKYQKNRTQGTNKWHEIQSEIPLRHKQYLDAKKRAENSVNESRETVLMNGEKFFENQEKERLSLLKIEREAFLRPFVDSLPNGLEDLDQDVFDSFLETKKKTHLEKLELERLETERIENERLEREKEIEAQRLENLRLKEESEAKEKALEKERAEAKAKQDAIELKAKQEREQAEKERKIEADRQAKIQAEKDAEIAKLKAQKEKEEADKLAKEKAEKAESDKLAKAPIKKQLSVWVESFNIPVVGVDNETSKEIKEKFEAFKKWSLTQVNNL